MNSSTLFSMELILMRHGIAGERDRLQPEDDAARELTDEGRRKTKKVAKALRELTERVDWIVTSPLVRARQTAEIVASQLGLESVLSESPDLRPNGDAHALLRFLNSRSHARRIIVVGHEPGLSQLAAVFLGGGANAAFAFKKSGCCLLSFDGRIEPGAARLEWWLPPKLAAKCH